MAREVIVRTWCDQHLAEGQRAEAVELPPLALHEVGSKPRVVALCEPCRKELYDPLVQLLKAHGQVVDEQYRPTKRATPAKVQGAAPVTRHGVEQEKTVTQVGGRTRAVWRSPGEYSCPVPDCDWVNGTRSALGQHTTTAHDELLSILEGRYGQLLNGQRVELPSRCPHCEAAYPLARALTVHVARAHG